MLDAHERRDGNSAFRDFAVCAPFVMVLSPFRPPNFAMRDAKG